MFYFFQQSNLPTCFEFIIYNYNSYIYYLSKRFLLLILLSLLYNLAKRSEGWNIVIKNIDIMRVCSLPTILEVETKVGIKTDKYCIKQNILFFKNEAITALFQPFLFFQPIKFILPTCFRNYLTYSI